MSLVFKWLLYCLNRFCDPTSPFPVYLFGYTHQSQHGDNSIEDLFNLSGVGAILEAGFTDPDDFMQVIFDTLVRSLSRDLGTKVLEVAA